MRKFIKFFRISRIRPLLLFYAGGIISTAWFLIRVIPKPSRAAYPCMRAAAPIMSGFVVYLVGLAGSAYAFRRAKKSFTRARYLNALFFVPVIIVFTAMMATSDINSTSAGSLAITPPPDGANHPMGIAKGIFPGRVTWAWDKLATDSTCNNTLGNRYYFTKNFNQAVIDKMVRSSLLQLTGANSVKAAWDSIFTLHNIKKTGIRKSYDTGELIFIKINQTTASWHSNADLSDKDGALADKYTAACQTAPPVAMSILRELIDSAGVDQTDIDIGDPISHIFKYNYDYWVAQYPDVTYYDNGRSAITRAGTHSLNFSDNGTTMTAINDDDRDLYQDMEDASYMINLSSLKAHVVAGITLGAKNHFGSPVHSSASNFHASLVAPNSPEFPKPTDATNTGYKKYRVQVDLMGNQYLGGNTMLSIVEGLWGGGANEIKTPRKWKMAPFNNNWCNSIFMSIDQVAIESVCYDFLRTEFNGVNQPESNPNWYGVDDYLHQAADSVNWPTGITYDPDGNGGYLRSLGVHEHWNDAVKKSYTRNLHTGNGIELVSIPEGLVYNEAAGIKETQTSLLKLNSYPNPFASHTEIRYCLQAPSQVKLNIYDMNGRLVRSLLNRSESSGDHHLVWNAGDIANGTYLSRIEVSNASGKIVQTLKLQVSK